jgi:hypothetical protein
MEQLRLFTDAAFCGIRFLLEKIPENAPDFRLDILVKSVKKYKICPFFPVLFGYYV